MSSPRRKKSLDTNFFKQKVPPRGTPKFSLFLSLNFFTLLGNTYFKKPFGSSRLSNPPLVSDTDSPVLPLMVFRATFQHFY